MWRNYFFQIQSKYNMRVSTTEPLVIRFDGKDVTKNKELNFFDIYNGSFTDAFEKTVKFFTEKYHGYSIFGSDEVSFIFPDRMLEDYAYRLKSQGIDMKLYPQYTRMTEEQMIEYKSLCNNEIALFSQIFFHHFNTLYIKDTIFWHGKCFSIPSEKLKSYIKYRSGSIKNVMVTYFLKKRNSNPGNIKLEDKIEVAKQFSDFKLLEDYQDGILYYDGSRISQKDFLENDTITKLKVELPESIEYIDLSSF